MIKVLVAYFAIIVNVAFAQRQYRISNINTQTFLQTAVAPGEPLTLGIIEDSWTIDPPLGDGVTVSTIRDVQTGLYAGVDQAVQDAKIIAVTDPYPFNIALSSTGSYIIYPMTSDLYWDTNATISPFIELVSESDIIGNDASFKIELA
ncbi:uncharacterized protein BX664DRAFT_323433 [Halteromyces radiatus]|uniref:uncharacterized protein n=1 Tax=Halteromyces radiatus TaxID=101107 RepID=UPI002220B873|nr:uncharacterized protein BX664DRAFT_323433 [Halteromyces radiatus]KAI8096235.1 hypothetical protein BX664DRAFT_323433 [Halteromyces radiatus]